MNYNHYVDLGYLERLAYQDIISARILWNLNFLFSARVLALYSLEKYLKILWAKDQSFKDEIDLNEKLTEFHHNIPKLLNKVNSTIRSKLNSIINRNKININAFNSIKLDQWKYGRDLPVVAFYDTDFSAIEKLVEEARKIYNQDEKGLLDDLGKKIVLGDYGREQKIKELIREILNLKKLDN